MANKKSAGKKKSAAKTAPKQKPAEKLSPDKAEAAAETAAARADKTAAVKASAGKASAGKNAVSKTAEGKTADSKKQAKKPNKAAKYFRDLRSEFKKVVWPSKKSVVNNTGVVLAVMVGATFIMWGLDSGFAVLLKGLLSLAGA